MKAHEFLGGLPKHLVLKSAIVNSRESTSVIFRRVGTSDMAMLHDKALDNHLTDHVSAFAELTVTGFEG